MDGSQLYKYLMQSLVREPFQTRRELLKSSFNHIDGVGLILDRAIVHTHAIQLHVTLFLLGIYVCWVYGHQ
jgi:hypothetical protein